MASEGQPMEPEPEPEEQEAQAAGKASVHQEEQEEVKKPEAEAGREPEPELNVDGVTRVQYLTRGAPGDKTIADTLGPRTVGTTSVVVRRRHRVFCS